ncbi:MAG TPA: biotin/lipoyl-binding protein, partial [Chitinophagales bacterium]|nr:biotin/lipoyl-binding protein [Chitinophagales bacterium]
KAPMPGLVLDILVEAGQAVNKGDNLIILEAMKMENIIKASGSGTVKSIHVQKKDAVEKNQLLIEME